jgi:hypothetical protein
MLAGATAWAQALPSKWIHGGSPCTANTDPPFQVHAYDEDTFVLRENKCIDYAALEKMTAGPVRGVHDDFIIDPR